MSMNVKQLRENVIEQVLKGELSELIPYSHEAVHLLLMTAAHESMMGTYIQQVGGPAQGIYQMEPATEKDIYENYLAHRRTIQRVVDSFVPSERPGDQLIGNLYYATAMARVHYWRVPTALPRMKNYEDKYHYVQALAVYAKEYFNTHLGKAKVSDYHNAFLYFCKDELDKDWNT